MKRILLFMALVLGLCVAHDAHAQNLTVKITQRNGTSTTVSGKASLQAALTGYTLNQVKALEISAGNFVTADWTWLKTNRTALSALQDFTITAGVSSVADIPDMVTGSYFYSLSLKTLNVAKVAKIGKSASIFCTALTTATFPQATSIGNHAFDGCTKLSTTNFPQVTTIGGWAFNNCSSLTTAAFKKATSIGNDAFNGCTSLPTATFPQATSIGIRAFYGCTKLTTATIPEATTIGNSAFRDCTSLPTANFPKATSIGDYAFNGCTSLPTASFPQATSIGIIAFKDCTKLSTLKLGATPPTVADANAFEGCPAVRNLVLTDANGTALTGTALYNAVQNYQAHAGYNPADGLWYGWKFFDINLYVTITTTTGSTSTRVGMRLSDAIGDVALGTIKSLSITGRDFATADWTWLKTNRTALNALQDFTIQETIGSVADIPNTTATATSSDPYFNPSSLKTLNVAKVAKIGNNAFYFCPKLSTATFPQVASIGNHAFQSCTKLSTATFPQATSIGNQAFSGCALTTATFPQVTTIGIQAFDLCTALTTANFPKATSIGQHAFLSCLSLTTATFPQATTIGYEAFKYCAALTTATFPKATTTGKGAFYDCTSLTTADFPQVTSIDNHAFYGCTSLPTADFPQVTSIGNSAFNGCTSLPTVNFPQATSIGVNAFYECTSLTTATFPQATNIGQYAFSNCTSLTTLKLGATPPTVADANAFEGCPAVRYLVPTDASGTALTGTALESAIQNYRADAGYSAADGLWYGWQFFDYNLQVTITTTTGSTSTRVGMRLSDAIGDVALGTIKSLSITGRDFATADWTWLKTNRTALNALQDFTIQETIGSVADIPNTTSTEPYFNPSSLKTLNVAKVAKIGQSAFYSCTKLSTASFPQVASIGNYAFKGCTSLTTATFPKATSIGDFAFRECESLPAANFPQVASIGIQAFYKCTKLSTATFPQATSIGRSAFNGCTSLPTVNFPKATSIGQYAFKDCTFLSTATFPQVTSIDTSAFLSCTKFSTLKLGATPPTVANSNAFSGCPSPRNLVFVNASGTALTGSALNTAVQNYRAHAGYNPADGLWYGWQFFDYNLQVTITTTTGSTSTRVGMRLSDAIGDVALGTIKSLSITGRDFATADWTWLKTNRTALNALQDFTIQETIGSVADIPNTTSTEPYFNPSSLKTLNVAKVAKIGQSAFRGCTALTTATFPQATGIGQSAFYSCTKLSTATFPQVASIGDYAFRECESLPAANFPQATSIGIQAFYKCTKLSTATFPQATSIGRSAFNGCTSLPTVNFPKATSIGQYAFKDCTFLSTATFPQVTSIDTSAFLSCTKFSTLKLGATPPTVANSNAFSGCPSPRNLVFVNASGTALTGSALNTAVQNYRAHAGYNPADGLWYGWQFFDYNLQVTITTTTGSTSTRVGMRLSDAIGDVALGTIKSLSITGRDFATADWTWLKTNRTALNALQDFTIQETIGSVADIPNTTATATSSDPYFNPSSLKTLNVAKVAKIGNNAFYFCPKLSTATFPQVASIGNHAFQSCTKLSTATFPQATSIGNQAFSGCALTTATFPQVTTIGIQAFDLCTALTTANFPKATSIGQHAFLSCLSLTTATFPQATTIGYEAFKYCAALTTATFPKATTTGKGAFYDCTSLTTADFPQVTSIDNHAFYGCTSLPTADFPQVTSIGNSAFNGCTSLPTVNFPQATSIGVNAFYECTSLTTATFPQATNIGQYAFSNCTSLTTLKLGATPPTVADANAFEGCPAVRYLVPTDASGTALTGTALESAIQNYRADAGYSAADDRWYGWILETYTVTVDSGITHGMLTASPNNDVLYGTTVRLTTLPAPSYQLKAGSLRAYKTGSPNTTVAVTDGTFTMPAYDVTVTCEFEAITYTWVQAVTAQPAGWGQDADGYFIIDSPEDLAWFISFVNGYNGCDMHPTANARITADLDMSAYQWLPIGSQVSMLDPGRDDFYSSPIDGYHGKFDGGYHAIKGLRNIPAVVSRSGLFDKIVDGIVQKVIVADCDFHVPPVQGAPVMYFGILANETFAMNGDCGIFFCEVSGKLTDDGEILSQIIKLGGLVGRVGAGSNVHSCISLAMLKSHSMCGLVAELDGGLYNCYTYPLFRLFDNENYSVAGSCWIRNNTGFMSNVYVREREPVDGYIGYYALCDSLKNRKQSSRGCLADSDRANPDIHENKRYYYYPADFMTLIVPNSNKKGRGYYTPTETPYMYRHADNKVSKVDPNDPTMIYIGDATDRNFVDVLNAWVDDHQDEAPDGLPYAKWSRTCASPVNDDYPVLLMPGANAVASDSIVLYYGDVNDLLLKKLDTPSLTDDAVFLYDDARLSAAAIQSTKEFYIGEGVCVLPEDPYSGLNGPTNTHVGVTFDNSATGWDWHLFSSSLTNAPLGIDYGGDNTPHQFSWDDPGVQYNFYDESVQDGFFPSKEYGTDANYYEHWDFYTYDEPSYHFINFKRNSNSHWHQDGNHEKINYTNEKTLLQGKGYMMAIDQPTFMQAKGVLNNSFVSHPVSHSAKINPGYNLVGNPYQAILDFDEVAGYQGNFCHFRNNMSYTTYDADQGGYVSYVSPAGEGSLGSSNYINGASTGAIVASRYISPLQGFFVYHPDESVTNPSIEFLPWFCKLRAEADDTYQGFRGGEEPAQPTFPLVNLIATDDKGKNDILVVEFDRPENGGARKMIPVRSGKGSLYARHQDENMSIAFVEKGITEIPVRFETIEDAVFTMTSKPANGPFRYLHLIDNITGIDHDLLAENTFTFEAKASDYKSRFKLVMALEAVEEPEDDVIADQFAYFDGGTWIVEAKGNMEVYDLTGRLLLSMHLANAQNSIDLSGLSVGVYLMRVSNGSDVKMQKIVLE